MIKTILKKTINQPKKLQQFANFGFLQHLNNNFKKLSDPEQENLQFANDQKSKHISSNNYDQFQNLKFKEPSLQDFEFLRKYEDTQQLKKLQKGFYEDKNSPTAIYLYLRELNRQQKYNKVLQYCETIPKLKLYEVDKTTYQKIMDLKQYAENEYKNNNNSNFYELQLRNSSQKQGRFLKFVRFIFLYGILYLSFDTIREETNLLLTLSYFECRRLWNKIMGNDEETDDDKSKDEPSSDLKSKFFSSILGKSDVEPEQNVSTRFSDVLGIDEFKEELTELVDYLKNPQKYHAVGAKLPKGILLVGPPGTGKTLLARALAGEANCNFFYKSGAEFDEMFVGVGASRVRKLFEKARKMSPSIIFIDEIDSVAGKRSAQGPSHSRDTINQILAEMDGFKQSDSVIVIGATNFEQSMDPAIKRPGRFDKTINVPLPDVKGRKQIFDYYLKKIKTDETVDPQMLSRQTSGFSGADIQNLVNIAILEAVKQKKDFASNQQFEFALDRVRMGIGRVNMLISEENKLLTAYHEGGHALISLLTEGATPLHKVTILPRGGALGFTSMVPKDDNMNMTKKSMIASIDVAMGGRAAEDLFVGNNEISTGCSSDLSKASEIAYAYVRQLGMNEGLSLIAFQDKGQMSDQYHYMIDQEVQKMLKESYIRVKNLLKNNEQKLKTLADQLIISETMSAEEVQKLLNVSQK